MFTVFTFQIQFEFNLLCVGELSNKDSLMLISSILFCLFTTSGYFGAYHVLVHYASLNAPRLAGKLKRGSPFSGRHWVPIKA